MKKFLKRLLVLALCLLTLTGLHPAKPAYAAPADTTKPFISLGADLTQDQRAVVLSLLGLTESDLANYNVTYVTNSMEQSYLGGYLAPEVIGTSALSSVKIIGREAGYGIHVTTYNINYCTEGMYQNALATAGVKNADVYVAGPCEISGTAALIGITQAYAQMTGQVLNAENVDAAANELVATGIIADAIGDTAAAEQLVAVIKDAVVQQGITDSQALRDLILRAAAEMGITLTDEEVDLIVDLMQKISSLDLNSDELEQQIADIYSQIKDLDITEEDIQNFWDEFGSFFVNLWNNLVAYFEDFF